MPEDQAGVRRSPFGDSIVSGRQRKKLSQSDLAQLLKLSNASMSRWERDTIPLDNEETHTIVNKVESALGYRKDFQWDLIAGTGHVYSHWPIEIPEDDLLHRGRGRMHC